ncbi:hypothetical protein WKW50_25710 [Ochrobactrum sp. GPK 3]|uniref:hypothetical protein n=1 Tax=Brucella sp. 22210 TaxID=3453892 RepID=UPI00313858BF
MMMTDEDALKLPSEDRMGFAAPKNPTHSLMLLNSYMRTDMLLHIHLRMNKLQEEGQSGSPLQHIARSLQQVVNIWDELDLFECFTRNHFHIDPGYAFRPEQDYLHDIELMKHHLKYFRKTIENDRSSSCIKHVGRTVSASICETTTSRRRGG